MNLSLIALYLPSGANAGGYCHHTLNTNWLSNNEQFEVRFTDEMTPRLEWTWTGLDFAFAAQVRFFCWQNCWCSEHRNVKNKELNRWKLSEKADLLRSPDGSLQINSKDENGRVTNARVSNYGIVTDGWITSSSSQLDSQLPSFQPNAQSLTCGKSCSGPAAVHCSGTTLDQRCKCVVSSTFAQVQQSGGLDRAFDSAKCIVVPFSRTGVAGLAAAGKYHSSLGGRDVSMERGTRDEHCRGST